MAKKLLLTAAQLEEMVRLGLIDSPEEVRRKLVEEEQEDRAAAGDTERGRKVRLAAKAGGADAAKGAKAAARDREILRRYETARAKLTKMSNRQVAAKVGSKLDDPIGPRAVLDAVKRAQKRGK